ncbi:MAG TPA: flavodoxin [Candidatus Scatomonas pullistercoris]|uniref:Flavodoxin n=1 Tax=Candidatus Scatomonas pullistercoris TaxID=2840920 RepID=A0A9D1T9Q9_9FIRM|nr:flavodoxin [Candidatus Scatomonas pullistercoris]
MFKETVKTYRPLIISYSYSGNTHRIAQELQKITGGDWCEIHPWQPYPMAFPELLKQVKQEIRSRYHPRLLPGARPPQLYPVVFAGSPDWCGTIAPPLASWLYQNDLSGKIILPFYSHCGGVKGNFQGDIARLCPRADVREALGIINDNHQNLTAVLQNWLEKNGLMKDSFSYTG